MTRWKKVEKKIFIYKKNLETYFVDFSKLVSIVELINSTSVDLSLHLWAIVTDQLSPEKLREQLFVQRKMTYLGEMTKYVQPQPDLTGCTDKSDPCFIEQIRRKSVHISHCLEILEFGARQKPSNYPILEQRPEVKVNIGNEQSIESIDTINIVEEEPETDATEKDTTEKLRNIFSKVVSSRLGIRRKSCYSPGSPKKRPSSPIRRRSTNDAYKINRKNVLENISMLATGPCGVGLDMKIVVNEDKTDVCEECGY